MSGSLKSLPAAYLTGFLLGKKILEKDEKGRVILDIGIIRSIPKTGTFAFLNGLVDAGVEISHKKETFPDESRIRGRHMKKNVDLDKIKGKITNG
jgi:large subunit ribosomal protein L18